MSRQIPLTRGNFAIVSDEDFANLMKYQWHSALIRGTLYAVRDTPRPLRKRVYMHRQVTNAPDGYDVDHIDMNGLNNQRSNLRVVPHFVNLHNTKTRVNNKSGFKGVQKQKGSKSWIAKIKIKGKSYHVGSFKTPQDAYQALKNFIADRFPELELYRRS